MTRRRGGRTLKFDFPQIAVGTAEYADGPTGCTVVAFAEGAAAAADARGGAVASREDNSVDALNTWGEVDAIVLAGGSTFGLEAASGVMTRLHEDIDFSVETEEIPSVPAAVVYDFEHRDNVLYPDLELGKKAWDSRRSGEVKTGRVGAGANVYAGTFFSEKYGERSGQGAHFFTAGEVKVFALCVVNALGNVLDENGAFLCGARKAVTGKPIDVEDRLISELSRSSKKAKREARPKAGKNTTLSIVVTNVALDRVQLRRVAVMGHAALARIISPFHTPEDGDVVYALSTQSLALPSDFNAGDIGVLAGRALRYAAWDAVGYSPDSTAADDGVGQV